MNLHVVALLELVKLHILFDFPDVVKVHVQLDDGFAAFDAFSIFPEQVVFEFIGLVIFYLL